MKRHRLKTWAKYWDEIQRGRKTFEIRYNDRDYQVGDLLELVRTEDDPPHEPTGEVYVYRVTYLTTFGMKDGYVCMGLGVV